MRLTICAMGRLRKGPELALIDDYLDRASKTGRALGLGPARVIEVDDRKATTMATQAEALLRSLPDNAPFITMDERGETPSSPQFAKKLAGLRDDGVRELWFVIGGADGIDPALRARAAMSISLGRMVWPHMLARVMLSEQIYRATTILAGTPYHRS